MWYTGANSIGVHQIGYATSADGIDWQKHPQNPVLKVGAPGCWDSDYVGYPEIIKIGTTYHMWYAGTDNFNNYPAFRMGYATSSDGINWTKAESDNPVLPVGCICTACRRVILLRQKS